MQGAKTKRRTAQWVTQRPTVYEMDRRGDSARAEYYEAQRFPFILATLCARNGGDLSGLSAVLYRRWEGNCFAVLSRQTILSCTGDQWGSISQSSFVAKLW
jgi:hypothetical protein